MRRILTKYKVTLFLLSSLIFQILIYNTLSRETNNLKREYENKLSLVKKYREKLEELPKIKERNEILKSEFKELDIKTFKGANDSIAYTEMLRIIYKILKELNVEGESITKLPTKSLDNFGIIRINIRFKDSNFRKILLFISKIERNKEKIMFFERLYLYTSKQSSKGVYLNLSANIGGVWLDHE